MLTTITFNLSNTAIRHERLHGRDYLVAPMAMLTEGVHNGSGGPLLYRPDDIMRAVPAWNMKPIVVYHPQINGQGVSACDPAILEAQQIGMVMNTRWDGKLRAEAWIDKARAADVDGRVLDALEANRLMEISTGLFTDNVAEEGEWNGEAYTAVATNHQPDHLAVLPDQIGACSIADGAGLLQLNEQAAGVVPGVDRLLARQLDMIRRMVGNAMSHSTTQAALTKALRERFTVPKDGMLWVVDVFDGDVIYEIEDNNKAKLYGLGYTSDNKTIELSADEPVEVVRVVEYRAPDGTFVGNSEAHPTPKESNMDKTKLVDGLIANESTAWGEDDRAALMSMDEAVLNKMAPVANGKAKPKAEPKDEEMVDGEAKQQQNAEAAAPITTEQYIAAAPAGIREVLTNSLATYEAEKAALIKAITANKANTFTPEFLATKDVAELRGLSALARTDAPVADATPAMFYGGAATPAGAPVANAEGDEPLALPTINFGAAE